jgi:2-iminobutanoate/2-iminopropanoate deaminase
MANVQKLCAPGVYDPPGYTQCIKVTGAQSVIFLAGQVAYDKDGGPAHRGDFKAQARAVFSAITAHVEAAGGTLANVVKITTYVTDVRYRPEFRAARDEFFGSKGPASTMVEVSSLAHPDYLIEIEAIAIV